MSSKRSLRPELQSSLIGTGRRRYQEKRSTCSDCSGGEWCYSDEHPTYVDKAADPKAPTGEQLIRHMQLYMIDRTLKEDFKDCVLPVATDALARKMVLAYYELRRRAPHFNQQPGRNNHKYIDPEALAALMGEKDTRPTVICEGCGKPFVARRSTAKHCSGACRERAWRLRAGAA